MNTAHTNTDFPEDSSNENTSTSDETTSDYQSSQDIRLTSTRRQPYVDNAETSTEEAVQVVGVVPPNPNTVRLQEIAEARARIRKQTRIRDACELSLYRLYKKAFPEIGPRREFESDEDFEARMNHLNVMKQMIRPIIQRMLDAELIINQSYKRCQELKHQ